MNNQEDVDKTKEAKSKDMVPDLDALVAERDKLEKENQSLKDEVASLKEKNSNSEKQISSLKQKIDKPDEVIPAPIPGEIKKQQYIKTGGGTFRIGSMVVKPNQVFLAYPHEIPERNTNVKPYGHTVDATESPVKSVTKYEIRLKKAGWFNVVNVETNKVMNEKGLRKEDALTLLDELS